MNEQWALKAIEKGEVRVQGVIYDIVSQNSKLCDGCAFINRLTCPHQICNSGTGYILVKRGVKPRNK